jgi:hypothetical protein
MSKPAVHRDGPLDHRGGLPSARPVRPSCSPTINTDALESATAELTAAGHRAIGVTCDVADEAFAAASPIPELAPVTRAT